MLSNPLRDLIMSEAELFAEAFEPASFFDRVEVGTLEVLDQAEHQLRVVAGVAAHDRRHRVEAREPSGTPSSLSRDQLVAVDASADEERLQHAVLAYRFGQLAQWLGVEARTDLLMRGASARVDACRGDASILRGRSIRTGWG